MRMRLKQTRATVRSFFFFFVIRIFKYIECLLLIMISTDYITRRKRLLLID